MFIGIGMVVGIDVDVPHMEYPSLVRSTHYSGSEARSVPC